MISRSQTSSPIIRKPSLFRSPRRHTPSSSPLPPPLITLLRILLILLVLWYEYGTFYSHASWCRFDDSPSSKSRVWEPSPAEQGGGGGGGKWKEDDTWSGAPPFHALVVADPQLLDMRSYPGRNWLLKWVGIKVTDAYARKAWSFVKRSKGKDGVLDGVVWLGDLLDSGVESVDRKEHTAYVNRFNLLFPLPRQPTYASSSPEIISLTPPVPTIYVAGNHDLGLHLPSSSLASYGRERFTESFGPTMGEKQWGGWDVTWVDSMALLEEGKVGEEAREWIERVGRNPTTRPRVLFSHIPLFRPEGTFCGRARESQNALRQGAGKNYQNELDEVTTKWLVDTLRPTLVYSGDDHDSCIINHPYNAPASNSPVVETTVKAFSMAMGVRLPGYHLLSLYPPTSSTSPSSATFTQVNCLLPDQLGIWLHIYLPLFIILTLCLLLPKLYLLSIKTYRRSTSSARSNGLPVHRHKKSLSRTLFSYAQDNDDDLTASEDADSQFPTFPFSPSPSDAYGYHSGLESDDLPTPARPSMSGGGGGGGEEGRVRRVSRVWMWENGGKSPFADLGGGGGGGGGDGGRGSAHDTLTRGSTSTSNSIGTVLTRIVRPFTRLTRQILHRLVLPGLIVKGWRRIGETSLGEVGICTVDEVGKIVGPAVGVWVGVWWWFAL